MSDGGQVAEAWIALGRQLAACRRTAGLSQERLAALAAYSRSTVANVETGRKHVGRDFWTRCDEVLGTEDALCRGFGEVKAAERSERAQAVALTRYKSLAVALDRQGDDPGPDVGTLGTDGQADDGAMLVLETGSARDPLVVGWLADALAEHARTSSMFGGKELLPLMVRHVRFLRAGLGSTRGLNRGQLVSVCARYAEFLGWLCQDLGRWGDAMFWSDKALEWAREGGDAEFVSYVLMRKSDLGEGRSPARAVLDLAEAAVRVPALGPQGRALVVQQEATGSALDGDVARFQRMIDQARDEAEAADGSDDAPWGLYCTPT